MKISPRDFWKMTLIEVVWAVDAWREGEAQKEKDNWERARMGWYYSLLPHGGRGLKPTDLHRFPWEDDTPDIAKIDKLRLRSQFFKSQH